MSTTAEAFSLAMQHHRAGDPDSAERLCRQILRVDRRHAASLHFLGVAAFARRDFDSAIDFLLRAVDVDSSNAQCFCNLGAALRAAGQLEGAIESYGRAIQLQPDHAIAHQNLGNALSQAGRLGDAVASYRAALKWNPDNPSAYLQLGMALEAQGQSVQAAGAYRAALQLDPGYSPAILQLGELFESQGQLADAADCFRRLVDVRPDDPIGRLHLAGVCRKLGRLDEAICQYRAGLERHPQDAESWYNLGNALRDADRMDESIEAYRCAIGFRPQFTQARNNLGAALQSRGEYELARQHLESVLAQEPDYAPAHNNLGNLNRLQGRPEDAAACYRQAVRSDFGFADAHFNLGRVLHELGRFQESIQSYRRAHALSPDRMETLINLGNVYFDLNALDAALPLYDAALARCPDHAGGHYNRALVWLCQGDYKRGWEEYAWRWKLNGMQAREDGRTRWQGDALPGGTILLDYEQGLGDTLQFVRYAKMVRERVGSVVVRCQEPLCPILAGSPGVDRVVPAGDEPDDCDVSIPLLSLPAVFRTTLETIPADVPYVFADRALCERWQPLVRQHDGFRVGIHWQGNPAYEKDSFRSIPLRCYAPLARVPGVRLFKLQKGEGTEQMAQIGFPLVDLDARPDAASRTLADTAALISNLDLVITSDTSIAHLAGALGMPVWLAVSTVPDWRWAGPGSTSPWYPTMRLFRQTRFADWDGVFERMAAALYERVENSRV